LCSEEEQSSQEEIHTRVKKPWEGIMWRSGLSLLVHEEEEEEVEGEDNNGPSEDT